MQAGVVMFPGSNCAQDTIYALSLLEDKTPIPIWHKDKLPPNLDLLILPGGFSYGDYLRSGAIARFAPVMEEISDWASRGGFVLGICNGFQILTEANLLPGSFLDNKDLKFISELQPIRVENNLTPYTHLFREREVIHLPIAHHQGNYFVPQEILDLMKENNQIVFRYCDRNGEVREKSNPNGALENIAGVINENGNVLGMMPHPERAMEEILGSPDGFRLFQSVFNYLKERDG